MASDHELANAYRSALLVGALAQAGATYALQRLPWPTAVELLLCYLLALALCIAAEFVARAANDRAYRRAHPVRSHRRGRGGHRASSPDLLDARVSEPDERRQVRRVPIGSEPGTAQYRRTARVQEPRSPQVQGSGADEGSDLHGLPRSPERRRRSLPDQAA